MNKKPGRKRRVAGWLLLVIGVLITGVWFVSRWWEFGWARDRCWCTARGGTVSIVVRASGRLYDSGGWVAGRIDAQYREWNWRPNGGSYITEPPTPSVNVHPIGSYAVLPATPWRSNEVHVEILLWPFALASLLGGGR